MRITNTLSDVPLRATPILFMADGTEYPLQSVNIPAAGVVEINLNDALQNAPPYIKEHLSTFGSAAIRYRWIWRAALSGTVLTVDAEHSLTFTTAFILPLSPTTPKAEQTSEGIFWLPFDRSSAFVTLYNASQRTITAQLSTFDRMGTLLSSSERSIPPNNTERVSLDLRSSDLSRRQLVGGARVSYQGTNRELIVNGGIEDYQRGFSLSMALVRPMTMDAATPKPYAVASGGLMNGIRIP